ncbi:hypothetical protein BSKO_12169 [Bryopsis sp. KO-2023]|nr:hypothetical protein BSKO_12169 [Bryopsis sp. KO-2023]
MAGGNARRASQAKRRMEETPESSSGSRPAKIPRHTRVEEEEEEEEEAHVGYPSIGQEEEEQRTGSEEPEHETSEEVDSPGFDEARQVGLGQAQASAEPSIPEAGPSGPPTQEEDLSAEASLLGRAMAESLREHEEMQARIRKPLVDKSTEEIIDKFCESQILLGALCKDWFDSLFSEKALKEALVGLLWQEEACNRWFPGTGTQQYFKTLTANLMETGDNLLGSKEFVSGFKTRISDEINALIGGYSVFPQGAPGGVPKMFADLQGSGIEVIDLLDD